MVLAILDETDQKGLSKTLKRIDVHVPLRTEYRTPKDTEWYVFCHLVASLAQANRIEYPFSAWEGDKPDFRLECARGERGVEITEAVRRDYAHACFIRDAEFPDVSLDLGHFRWGTPPLTGDQIRRILAQGLTTPPRGRAEDEGDWRLYVKEKVEEKLRKLRSKDIESYPENWLAVYDNLPFVGIDRSRCGKELLDELDAYWELEPRFEKIFVVGERMILCLAKGSSEILEVNDLWTRPPPDAERVVSGTLRQRLPQGALTLR